MSSLLYLSSCRAVAKACEYWRSIAVEAARLESVALV